MNTIVPDMLRTVAMQSSWIFPGFSAPEHYTFKDHVWGLLGGGVSSMFVWVTLMVMLVILFYRKNRILEFCSRHLTKAFASVWVLGFLVYNIGLYPGDQNDWWHSVLSLLGVAPMAIVHAFGMFVLQSDVSAIHSDCFSNSWFMFFFAAAHFLAAVISMLFVIKFFGFNIVSNIKRFWATHFGGEKEELYVFWGMSDAAYYFVKDFIRRTTDPKRDLKEKQRWANSQMVVVRISDEKEGSNERMGMERLFSFMTLSKAHLEKLQELQSQGCIAMTTYGSLANLVPPEDGDIICRELQLHSLSRLIAKTTRRVHLFFLDDNAEQNIQAVANLRRDSQLAAFLDADENRQVKIYCHARYNSIHRVVEDELTTKQMEVKVVDSSHICVELLKKNPSHHPVEFVKVESDATVSSPFNALVIGFGEVGVDATRFLYEFGAFVGSSSRPDVVRRSEFHCHVIDSRMDELAGLFLANSPSIAMSLNRREEEPAQLINLYNMDGRSAEFYQRLKSWINDLNYVVVATGDDEMNISLAVRILRLAIRDRRLALQQLHILVRVQHDENGHILRIAQHYNRMWKADLASTEKYRLHQRVVGSEELVDGPLALFGAASEIYSYDYLVSDLLKEDAKRFRSRYEMVNHELQTQSDVQPYPLLTWEEEQNDLMQLTGEYQDFSPTYSGIMKLRRVQGQNYSNSLHKTTKIALARKALGDELETMRTHGLTRKHEHTTYVWKDGSDLPLEHIQRVMDVLAQTEHLRWNASHEILGYQVGKAKDEARLCHDCLRDWEELSEVVQSYDYNVVDVSLEEPGKD